MKQLLIFLFLLFASCASHRYTMITPDQYTALQKSNTLKYTRYIVIDTAASACPPVMASTVRLLKNNDADELDRYLDTHDIPHDDSYFMGKTLAALWNKNYSFSLEYLASITTGRYLCLKKLLTADCRYELNKGNKNQLILLYQDALDCNYSDIAKDIIAIRIKLITYNY